MSSNENSLRRIALFGATGSIGVQARTVIDGTEGTFAIVACSVGSDIAGLAQLAEAYPAAILLCADKAARSGFIGKYPQYAARLAQSVDELLDRSEPDCVLNAVVGSAGLGSTVASLSRGIDVALANKESLVVAGSYCMQLAVKTGARIIPVDSEHSALMQCLGGATARRDVDSLVLTASGGPFFGSTLDDLRDVTVAQALNHPTWSMGGKISIDSATLMNKGLELIEAMVLFDVAETDVEIVVHRDSIVHAMVRHVDGSLLAHLGWPDMHVPISWALNWPSRAAFPARHLDLVTMPALEFHEPDTDVFRCLALARYAAAQGGCAPAVLNAANEVAVAEFLAGHIGFLQIPEVVESTLDRASRDGGPVDISSEIDSLETAITVDRESRELSAGVIAAHFVA